MIMDNKMKLACIVTVINVIATVLAFNGVSVLWYWPVFVIGVLGIACAILVVMKNKAWGIILLIINILTLACVSSPLLLA